MGLSRCTEKNDFVISCELISEDHTLKSIHICSGFFTRELYTDLNCIYFYIMQAIN